MEIRPIHTPEDHAAALKAIEELWGAPAGSSRGDKLDILATLVDAYEREHFPLEERDPIDTIKAHMRMNGYSMADFAAVIGSRSRASELLNRRRPLNLQQVHRIVEAWKVPAELLIQPYRIERAA
ncbi:MAG TPA: transcriptional regulator [Pararhizobium sp.]|nr:transcriptional regulator [Pararhizobium sp.]